MKSRIAQILKRDNRCRVMPPTGRRALAHRTRGQSLVEMALVLPLLVILFSVVVEAGMALNAWLRVNTAARDATRFVLDAGRDSDTANLVIQKLIGIDFGSGRNTVGSRNLDVFVIKGSTNGSGNITAANWVWTQIYDGDGTPGSPRVSASTIQARLRSQAGSNPANIPFVIVEVDFRYTPLLSSLLTPGSKLPMSSYAIIQKNDNN